MEKDAGRRSGTFPSVLGIVHGHNATVCLSQGGKVVFCQSEERLNRVKNSAGFPRETLDHVYRNIAPPETIDMAVLYEEDLAGYVALKLRGFKPVGGGQYLAQALPDPGPRRRFLRTGFGSGLAKFRNLLRSRSPVLRAEAGEYFSRELRLPRGKIRYLDHHLSHAYSALANVRDQGRAIIFTLDANGDGRCATVNLFDHGKLTTLCSTDEKNSLGAYYLMTTLLLGMKAPEDEHKVMGLAPYPAADQYGDLVCQIRGLIRIDASGNWESSVDASALPEVLGKIFRARQFDRIAGAIQSVAEDLVREWVEFWVVKTGCGNVGVAGGVFMNIKVSRKVADIPSIGNLFVVPSAGDESCALGCAAWGALEMAPATRLQPLDDLYLGMAFDRASIERALVDTSAGSRYRVSEPENVGSEVAALLAQNRIVARFSGAMEFGARALGNRSLLAHPGDLANVQRLNRSIKNRDFWMPFSPSILEEDMSRYIVNPKGVFAPYMSLAFDTVAETRGEIAAAIHPADFTARPQVVRKAWNPGLHEIISLFRKETGTGAVLNTSFNLHGEPIVCSPSDAIRAIDRSGLEYLALGELMLVKKPGLGHAAA